MRALRRAGLRLLVVVAAGGAGFALALGSPDPAAAGLPHVQRQGHHLTAAGERFRVWGFNYGVGDRYPILRYFDRPTDCRLRRAVADMREARSLGANSLRIYLEVRSFMRGPSEPNRRALDALAALLEKAERLHVYLDLTGNLVWRAPPAWYDALPEQARWAVQARFWRAVARTAARSPAVLLYELTSEPVIDDSDRWYGGEFGGYTFVQRIVRQPLDRDRSELARRWIRLLTRSIREYDHQHLIGLGLLPVREGAFGPSTVADLLDVLLVHEYPQDGAVNDAISLVRAFASQGKPVILGETAPLHATLNNWTAFLRGSRRYLEGYLSFYDGRVPAEVAASAPDAWYAAALGRFVRLRDSLVTDAALRR